MGLISRVSSRTYRKKMSNEFQSNSSYPPITENMQAYDTRCFTDRYFDTFSNPKNPLTLALKHTNGLYLVKLNPEHEIFKKYEQIEVSYQVTDKLNRANNKVSGRRKLNGQWIDQTGTLAILKLKESANSEVTELKIISPVRGKLFSVNKGLGMVGDVKASLLKETGFIAIIMPNKRDSTAEAQPGLEPVKK